MKQRKVPVLQLPVLIAAAVTSLFVLGSLIHFAAEAAGPLITITRPTDGQYLNSVTPTVYGTTYDANATVNVYIDDMLAGSTTSAGDGSWDLTPGPLAEVSHTVYATTESGYTSALVNFTVDVTPPPVTITYPEASSYVNLPLIEGVTEPETQVTVSVYGRQATVTSDMLGYWFYFDETLPEGTHEVRAKAIDRAGNEGFSATHSFVLDMTRPVVSTNLTPPDVMTRVYREQVVSIQVYDDSPLDQAYMASALSMYKINSADGTVDTSVYGTVYGSVYFNADTKEISFTPDAPLDPMTKYYVTVDPLLADIAGNPIYTRSWTFTTMGDESTEKPHGNYIENVNVCVTCHRPHNSDGPKLNKSRFSVTQYIDNYCTACHDGTVAPIPEKWQSDHKHNFEVSIDGTTGTNSCASCHNPHLTWTTDNPNLLQDYDMYLHNDPTNPYLPSTSEQALCESCHTPDIKDDQRVSYVRYRYETWHTTSGTLEDYGLCLRCHDGGNAVNIAQYYSGPSRHMTVALDESPLNGHLACSDCHETHGSSNIKNLKTRLGHNNAQAFQAGSVWDPATERLFCTSCHNNLTELYGITVEFDTTIPGHEAEYPDGCSRCHGGSPRAAAHAPS